MAQQTGILSIEKLLEVETQSIHDYGYDRVAEAITTDLEAHNEQMMDMVDLLAAPTTENVDTYGGGGGGEMQEVDQEGRAPTQQTEGFSPVAYPLRKFQFNIGWTNNFMRTASPADMARQTQNAQARHRAKVIDQVAKALYGSSNYTFNDFLVNNLDLSVKRLVNADGEVIPPGTNGESFDSTTHTHYDGIDWTNASTSQRNGAVERLVDDVIEHGHGDTPIVVIARGDESKVKDLDDFEPYKPVQIMRGDASDHATGTLRTDNLYDRAIGVLSSNGAEVWVKPWAVTNYMLCTDIGASSDEKPLRFRQRDQSSAQGLQLQALIEAYPITAEIMEAEFGFGVHQRTNGAILYLGNSTYQDPSFA